MKNTTINKPFTTLHQIIKVKHTFMNIQRNINGIFYLQKNKNFKCVSA